MALEQTWRWFGPKDPVKLVEVKQAGATGVVTALHQIPVGEIWPVDEIKKRKEIIESKGLRWSVAESVPVHENIKKRKGNYQQLIKNYKESIRNLSKCGISNVCYNFMPILDWSRTDLKVKFNDGSITTRFEAKALAAFDLFLLKRKNAEKNYNEFQIKAAEQYFKNLDNSQKDKLIETILLGLPGSLEAYTLDEFRSAIEEYDEIGDADLRYNLYAFIKEIIPAAEESGVLLGIHPDDPPWSLFGLPRIVSNKSDLEEIINVINSPSNGLTVCTGSLGVGYKNDLVDIVQNFAGRINFVHLRNVSRNVDGDFMEENHFEGDIDIFGVMKALILEEKRRENEGRKDSSIPMRPDHGHLMLPDQGKEGIYPGYSLFGRMRGLSELRGLEMGIRLSLQI
ncbi:MAG: mannonate dehydratase [Ignavibacteriaceae bacterium]